MDIEQTAIDIIQPVLEQALVLSGEYAKACGRDTILSQDMEYCIKYCAMNTVGLHSGSLFPEIYDGDDEDSDEEDFEIVNEKEEGLKFERYSGGDDKFLKINESYDIWDEWVPQNEAEQMIKDSIDNNSELTDNNYDDFWERTQ